MVIRFISIPQEQLDYLEGLWYMAEGAKQLVRHLASQERTKSLEAYLAEQRAEYARLFTEYNMALNMVAGEYAKEELEAERTVAPNFALGALEVRRGVDV
jgi:cell division septum initiation protein DivIVA